MTRRLIGMPAGDDSAGEGGIAGRTRPDVNAGFQSDSSTMLAWERFLAGEITTAAPTELIASWKRSLQSGVNPTSGAAPFAVHGDAIDALRWRHRELLAASDRLFAATADLFVGSSSILLLTNADGVILKAAGDLHTLDAGEKIHLMTGGDWREATAGTNGIGTALATRQPTYIHASEHFCEGIKAWSCAAAPICEPGTGAVLGVLDISGPPSTYQINNLTLAVTAARQIEMVLAEQVAREQMRLLAFCLQRLSSADAAGLIAIDRRGRFVHTTARIPLPINLGERFPGMSEHCPIEDWPNHLPQGLRPEWFDPVVADGEAIGAMLIVPAQSGLAGASRLTSGARRVGVQVQGRSEADPKRNCFGQIICQSAAMQRAIDRGRQLARRRVPVLIEGQTGVGKELFARAIHGEESGEGPFVAYNCGAASKELIGAELFGHVRGAYTGATAEGRPGRFELAHGGTLCLDEIGELPLDLQPILLRALEEGVIYRLGDTQPRRVDVRLLAMTNRNLREEVECGRFRADLYYRVGVTRICIPSLRERDGDVDLLIEHFNRALALRHGVPAREFADIVMEVLRAYSWPGNVRELRNLVENLLLTSNDKRVMLAELPAEVLDESPAARDSVTSGAAPGTGSLEETERFAIARALRHAQGNMAQAARALGVSRSTLYRKMEQYRIRAEASAISSH